MILSILQEKENYGYQITEHGQKELLSEKEQWMHVHNALSELRKPLKA